MISDVLSEADAEIRRYLRDMPDVYAADREKIQTVLAAMDSLRAYLDTPPGHQALESATDAT